MCTLGRGILTFCIGLFLINFCCAQDFDNLVYLNPNIIGPKDVSVLDSITFDGWSIQEVYDRRLSNYTNTEVAIFKVFWKQSGDMEVHVLKELIDHSNQDSALNDYVQPYAYMVGQLPSFLLKGIHRIVLLGGDEICSAADGSIYIHPAYTGNSKTAFVEEVLIHEGGHASLDNVILASDEWKNAQQKDSLYISKYAKDNLETEDLAESILAWLSIRYRSERVSTEDSLIIASTIPNRLKLLDSYNFEVYPFDQPNEFDYLYALDSSQDIEDYMTLGELLNKIGLFVLGIIGVLLIIIITLFKKRNRF